MRKEERNVLVSAKDLFFPLKVKVGAVHVLLVVKLEGVRGGSIVQELGTVVKVEEVGSVQEIVKLGAVLFKHSAAVKEFRSVGVQLVRVLVKEVGLANGLVRVQGSIDEFEFLIEELSLVGSEGAIVKVLVKEVGAGTVALVEETGDKGAVQLAVSEVAVKWNVVKDLRRALRKKFTGSSGGSPLAAVVHLAVLFISNLDAALLGDVVTFAV
mmetsp:Transcript_14500/g.25995  ORF Transcript_14500/g.25995 Transcript_14500/m.25995 type:complete len:212 (+) Transcript_14500:357-992(+)